MKEDKQPKRRGAPKQRLPDGSIRYDVPVMCRKVEEYVERNKKGIPILKECCLENDWHYDRVIELQREFPELARSIKKIHAQKEVNLQKGVLSGKLNPAMAIFMLKQPWAGWKDKWDDAENKDVINKLDEVLSTVKSNI